METTLILDALTIAVWRQRRKGSVIIHSDQGSQFGSDEFSRWCKENRLSPSMSRGVTAGKTRWPNHSSVT